MNDIIVCLRRSPRKSRSAKFTLTLHSSLDKVICDRMAKKQKQSGKAADSKNGALRSQNIPVDTNYEILPSKRNVSQQQDSQVPFRSASLMHRLLFLKDASVLEKSASAWINTS